MQGSDQPGDTDESDFHNQLGSIAWEKRATDGNPVLLAGATFEISPNPLTGLGTLTVVDGGRTMPTAWPTVSCKSTTCCSARTRSPRLWPRPATRLMTIRLVCHGQCRRPERVIGVQGSDEPGNTDESDFHNQLGSIAWEKRATDGNPVLLPGATFEISPNPLTGLGTLTVVDGGANDADGLANGVLQVNNVLLGTYTITETVAPPGYAIDDDPTRVVTVSAADSTS